MDVYGTFQALVLTLKQEHMAELVGVRRRDDSKTILYVKALKKWKKEMVKLISTIQNTGKYCSSTAGRVRSVFDNCGEADEIEGVIEDVNEVTIAVSLALFRGISSSFCMQKSTWKGGLRLPIKDKKKIEESSIEELEQVIGTESCLWGLSKKRDEEVKMVVKKMYEMENCLCGIECGADKLFRSLINSRVSMLNVLT